MMKSTRIGILTGISLLIFCFTIYSVLGIELRGLTPLSVLGGDVPDVIAIKEWSAIECEPETTICKFEPDPSLLDGNVPVWASGEHKLTLTPLLSLDQHTWMLDNKLQTVLKIDGREFKLKDGERLRLTQYMEVKVAVSGGIENFLVFPEKVTERVGTESILVSPPPVFKSRLTSMRIELFIYLDPDGINRLDYAGPAILNFKSTQKAPYRLSVTQPGLEWTILSRDESSTFFLGAKANSNFAGIVNNPVDVNVPVNTMELGKRTITAWSAIKSRTFRQSSNEVFEENILTRSANGVSVALEVQPIVEGQPTVIGQPIQVRVIKGQKVTYGSDSEAVKSLKDSNLFMFLVLIAALIGWVIYRGGRVW